MEIFLSVYFFVNYLRNKIHVENYTRLGSPITAEKYLLNENDIHENLQVKVMAKNASDNQFFVR